MVGGDIDDVGPLGASSSGDGAVSPGVVVNVGAIVPSCRITRGGQGRVGIF
jgi:hypothetical protein